MAMDILCLDAVVRELNVVLRGAAINQIYQPGAAELVLRLWTGRENVRLLISASARESRMHLSAKKLPNPQTPPRFCQLLRSRLKRLQEIERIARERIVRLTFTGEGGSRWTLVAELLGSQANLILLDFADRVVDALRRQEQDQRILLPGQPYVPPPLRPTIDLTAGIPEVPEGSFQRWLVENISPMTPLQAAELSAQVACGAPPRAVLGRFRENWMAGEFQPCILTWQGRRVLSPFLPEYLDIAEVQHFTSLSAAADAFYAEAADGAIFGGGRHEFERVVRKAMERLEKRLDHITAEATRTQDFDRQRQLGDLLLANLFRLRRGMAEIVLDDWYADPPTQVAIPLDPSLSPQENADAYFRRHRKGKRGQEHIVRRRSETLEEIDWLAGVGLALEEAETASEFQALRQELMHGGVIKDSSRGPRKLPEPTADSGLLKTLSPSGLQLIWGRNNHSNDRVSKQLTGSDDLWFHAHNLPGCHLVLKREGRRDIAEVDILYAASLAAGYSRGRNDLKVEVMVAEGRTVRKPKGARPGLVLADPFRTLMVPPRRLRGDDSEKKAE